MAEEKGLRVVFKSKQARFIHTIGSARSLTCRGTTGSGSNKPPKTSVTPAQINQETADVLKEVIFLSDKTVICSNPIPLNN